MINTIVIDFIDNVRKIIQTYWKKNNKPTLYSITKKAQNKSYVHFVYQLYDIYTHYNINNTFWIYKKSTLCLYVLALEIYLSLNVL